MYFVSVDGSALSCYQVVVKIFFKKQRLLYHVTGYGLKINYHVRMTFTLHLWPPEPIFCLLIRLLGLIYIFRKFCNVFIYHHSYYGLSCIDSA